MEATHAGEASVQKSRRFVCKCVAVRVLHQKTLNGQKVAQDTRHALRDACRKAKLPHRLLHDCRRTAARNLIRAAVPERVAILLTGHKTRAVFDRYNIVNEQELLTAGERLAAYVAKSGS